jgi:hypothetical protein
VRDLKDALFLKLAKKAGFPTEDGLARLLELQGDRSLFRTALDEQVLDDAQKDELFRIAEKLLGKKKKNKKAERGGSPSKKSRHAARSSGTLTVVKAPVAADARPKSTPPRALKAKKKEPKKKTAPPPAPVAPPPKRSRLPLVGTTVAALGLLAGGGYYALGLRSNAQPNAPVAPAPIETAAAPPVAPPPVEKPVAPPPIETAAAPPVAPPPVEKPVTAPPVERPITVDGWKLRFAESELVAVALAQLPERSSSALDRPGAALVLTSEGKPVPFFLADEGTLVFQAQADPSCRDERGRCYHLHVAAAGEKSNRLEACAESAPKFDEAAAGATVTVYPAEPPAYDPLPAYDLASVSKEAKVGGYWFHPGRLTFPIAVSPEKRDATLHLGGIFVRGTRPAGDDMERLASAKKSGSSKLTVSLGGAKLGEVVLGKNAPEGDDADIAIPAGRLGTGSNAVELTAEPAGTVLVQRASLECSLPIGLAHESVAFRARGATAIADLPSSGRVADLTSGRLLPIARDGNRASVAAEDRHELVAFDPTRAKTCPAATIEPCRRSDLRESEGADWVAIAPRALVASIEPLAAHRKKTGLDARVVALEDVEDAFADGSFGPEGIRAFLAFTQESWKKKPRFALLVGDAHHDARPKGDVGAVLPTALVDSFENGATASDFALAPRGVAIGRFPVRTAEQASALVAKTIAYEQAGTGPWQKQLAFVCGEGHFGAGADAMIENLFTEAVSKRVPDSLDVDVTYGNPGSIYFYPPDEFSNRVTERLSQGALIVNYVGHGGPESFDHVYWGTKSYPIFGRADAEKVACEGSHNPIVLITACLTGAFDEEEETVGEALVLNPKGAIAVFAASRESSPITNAILSLELTSRLFKDAGEVDPAARPRLGERLRAALADLSPTSGEGEGKAVLAFAKMMGMTDELLAQFLRDGRAVYNLLGDPALAVQYPRAAKLEAPEESQAGKTIEVTAAGLVIERATLERTRKPPSTLKGLPESTRPEALTSPEIRKKILKTYGKANDFVVLEGKPSGSKATFALPKDLPRGTYVLKVWTAQGGPAVAAARVQIEEADDDDAGDKKD